MDDKLNANSRFRSDLARELPIWTRRGVIDSVQAGKLTSMYELKELESESAKLFSRAIMAFGALLLGGGVMAFVAANWEELPKLLKVIMLFAALLGFHGAGFWLWQKRDHERLGRALIFAGCLVFGANIGLLAQIFNIQGDTYRGVGAWALGTLAMAWAIRSSSSALLALVLSFIWYSGYLGAHHDRSASSLLIMTFPILVIGLFGTLAALIPSKRLMGSTFVAFFISMAVVGATGAHYSLIPPGATLIVAGWLALATGRLFEATPHTIMFAPLSQAMGWVVVCFVGIIMSFSDPWGHSRTFDEHLWLLPLFASAVVGALAMRESLIRKPADPGEKKLLTLLGASLALMFAALIAHQPVLSPLLGNIACLGWAMVCVFKGLNDGDRSAFWSGAILVFLLILARFFEFDTSLMLKSLAFLVCGAGTIYAGIRYEAHLRGKGVAQ